MLRHRKNVTVTFLKMLQRPDKPSWSGTWDASYYRPACPQHMWHVKETVPGFNKQNVSEDCLYMNIFVPHVSIIWLL